MLKKSAGRMMAPSGRTNEAAPINSSSSPINPTELSQNSHLQIPLTPELKLRLILHKLLVTLDPP